MASIRLFSQVEKKERFWIIACVITIFLRALLSNDSIERFYARGLFPKIRKVLDAIHHAIPIYFLWLVIIALTTYVLYNIYSGWKKNEGPKQRAIQFTIKTISILAMVFTLFMWLWGFNYGRLGIYKQLDIVGEEVSKERLIELAKIQQDRLTVLRPTVSLLPNLPMDADSYGLPPQTESKIVAATIATFEQLELGLPGKPKPRILYPKGTLLRISTAGFYSPWTGEANVDGGLHPLQIPSVMAHELSHAMGITDEGGCNFMAVLIGRKMDDPWLQYAFELSYWRQIMGRLKRKDEASYKQIRTKLPIEIKQDLESIKLNSESYPDIFPKIRDFFYDNFLKSQGVKAGLKSYAQVVNMVEAWDKKIKSVK